MGPGVQVQGSLPDSGHVLFPRGGFEPRGAAADAASKSRASIFASGFGQGPLPAPRCLTPPP